jgi:peroxiredoxin
MQLQDRLDGLTNELIASGKIPDHVVAGLMESIREQVESGQADRALKAGETAPSFVLKDADGETVDSKALIAKGPLVLSFYRGVWCGYCNLELKALEKARGEIEARGASLVAISMQTAANSRKSARENGLSFPILIDAGGKLSEAVGLRHKLSPKMIGFYKDLGNDLEVFNGDDSWMLPMPGRYVIGQDGVVAYAEINPDFTKRPDPSELYPVLEQLARSRAA